MNKEITLKDIKQSIKTLKLERNLLVCNCPHCLVFGGICNKCQIFYFDPDSLESLKDLKSELKGGKNDTPKRNR